MDEFRKMRWRGHHGEFYPRKSRDWRDGALYPAAAQMASPCESRSMSIRQIDKISSSGKVTPGAPGLGKEVGLHCTTNISGHIAAGLFCAHGKADEIIQTLQHRLCQRTGRG